MPPNVHAPTVDVDRIRSRSYAIGCMCRNIRVLHHFEPPTSPDEIRAAALQFVRKVSGVRAPSKADTAAFEKAIDEVAETTARLLAALPERGAPRTREGEKAKARVRWTQRKSRILDAS